MNEIDPSETGTADPAIDIQRAVARIYRRVRSEQPGHQLGDTQLSVLTHLVKQGPRTLRELSDRERIRPPSMNQAVNVLQAAGLVAREPDPSDGRKVLVTATARGAELVSEGRRVKRAWLATRLAGLSDTDRRTLVEAARIFEELARS